MTTTSDYIIIGGGMIGVSIAYGLAKSGCQVMILDEGDMAYRAARGNFGLVWVQGKGVGVPHYASHTRQSAVLWPGFAEELKEMTGVDPAYHKTGGLDYCLSDEEFSTFKRDLELLRDQSAGEFTFEALDNKAVREIEPEVGKGFPGAMYSPMDGHANPLYLLRALHQGFKQNGGNYKPRHTVQQITPGHDHFDIQTEQGAYACGRVILAAGLGNARLAPMVGLDQPVYPVRGQILATERLKPFLRQTSVYVRQTDEGGVLIGDSKEHTGFDDGTDIHIQAKIAARATRIFPCLKPVRVVRTWGALRVMTKDGMPIYEISKQFPGAFAASSHSGVTLAASNALSLPRQIIAGQLDSDLELFTAARLNSV